MAALSSLPFGSWQENGWRAKLAPSAFRLPRKTDSVSQHCNRRCAMGTWGAGNFADDSSLDWLYTDVQKPLMDTIERELHDHDEGNGTVIIAAVEVLALICEHTPAMPPKPEDVARWRQAYLKTWNGYIDGLDPKAGYKETRLQAIEATFDRLATVARQ